MSNAQYLGNHKESAAFHVSAGLDNVGQIILPGVSKSRLIIAERPGGT